jgi:type IV pilus assembly protein PilY1
MTQRMRHALPHLVVALALVFFGIRVAPWAYQTLGMAVFALVVIYVPLAIGALRASMLQVPPSLEEAARGLGRGNLGVALTITAPLVRSGALAAATLVYIGAIKELPAMLLLAPTGYDTLATVIWQQTNLSVFEVAAVPSLVLPNLYKLADKNYAALHQYFVDGTPVAADICPSAPATACTGAQWRTILVGGLNRGGRGYYALDITDPAAPKALWEFTDANMGYTYGNPEIAKLADGTWAVLFTSGYNNISPGDGVGRLYVVNAATGALIRTISTGSGSSGTPSGLARVRAWADNAMADNTAVRIYGGDLLGNLWRFDINDNVGASGYEAERLTTFYGNAAGTAVQPITTKPELGEVNGNAMVFVGTGRYLGTTDLSDASLQSFYAVKDRLGNAALTPLANPRANGSGFIQQMLTTTACPPGSPATICSAGETVRTGTANAVDLVTDNGWYLDLPDSGERANTDPTLALGTLGFTTNVPNVSACTAGGYSFSYFLDYRSGAPVSTSTTHVVGAKLGNALATRGVFVRLPNNTVVQLTRMSDGTTKTTNVPIGSGSGATRRVSWRELVNE